MADTTFVAGTVIASTWLNDINDLAYEHTTYLPLTCAGDGVTNDATALQAAITAGAGGIIDGLGLTYKCNSVLTGITSNTVLQNMTLDFSDVATSNAIYLYATGSQGSTSALTANLAADATSVSIASTSSYASEYWVWLQSTAVWSTTDGTVFGQVAKIETVDSGTAMTLYTGCVVPFNTAASATIRRIVPVERVIIRNVHIIGSGAGTQTGIRIDYGLDCVVENNCSMHDVDYAGVVLYRCINTHAAPTVRRARATGLSYGVVLSSGCLGCKIEAGYGEDLRHYVTVGGTSGINVNCSAKNNVVMYARSAGIDTHDASFNFIAEGNQITLTDDSIEGITLQGLHSQAINNTLRNVRQVGVFIQCLVDAAGYVSNAVVKGNHVHLADGVSGTQIGVYIQNRNDLGGNYESVSMVDNTVYGGVGSTASVHFYILTYRTSGQIKNIVASGNISAGEATDRAMFIRTLATSSSIENVVVTGNRLRSSGAYVLEFLADGTGTSISQGVITSNIMDGGSTAVVGINGTTGDIEHISEDTTVYTTGGSLFAVTGSVADVRLQTSRRSVPTVITSSTQTVPPYTDAFICNRAGTITLTLPSAAIYVGRELFIKTIQAQLVVSDSSNVVPLTSATAGTAILAAVDGAWASLKSDGTNWQVMAGS